MSERDDYKYILLWQTKSNLLDVLAVGRGLFPRQTDEKTTAGLRGVALLQLEHVAARLADRGHLGDHRQVVDNKADLE